MATDAGESGECEYDFNIILDEACNFHGFIKDLLETQHTCGMWCDGLAVKEIFMEKFGWADSE